MLKRLGMALAPVVAIGIILWLLPLMLSWEGPAERLKTRLREATGYELVVKGEVQGTLLPRPALLLTEIEIHPPEGKGGISVVAPLVKVMTGWSVLWSEGELGDLQVVQPRLWQEGASGNALAVITRMPLPVSVVQGQWGKDTAEKGPVFSFNWQPGASESRFQAQAGEGKEAWKMQGTVAAAGDQQPQEVALEWSDEASQVTLKGKMLPLQEDVRFSGDIGVKTSDWAQSLSHAWPYWKALGLTELEPKVFEGTGRLQWGEGRIKLEAAQITAGEDRVAVNLDIASAGPVFALSVEAAQAVADPYVASAIRIAEALKQAVVAGREQTAEYKLGVADTGLWSASAMGKVEVKAPALQWRGMAVRDVAMQWELAEKVWTLHQASAVLPGEARAGLAGVVKDYQNDWMFMGKAQAEGVDLRQALGFIGMPLPEIPQGRLGAFTASGTVTVTPLVRRVTELALEVDGGKMAGAVIVRMPDPNAVPEPKKAPGMDPALMAGIKAKKDGQAVVVEAVVATALPEVEASLAVMNLDVDSYMPPEPFLLGEEAAAGAMAARMRWLAELPFKAKLGVVAQPATFRGMVWDRIQAKCEAEPGRWETQAFKAYKQGGAIFTGSFMLAPGELRPRMNVTLAGGPLRDTEVMDFVAGAPQPVKEKGVAQGEYKWSEAPIDLTLLGVMDGTLVLQLDQLHMLESDFKEVRMKGALQDLGLVMEQLQATLSQGTVQVKGSVRGGTLPTLDAVFALQEIDIEKLLGIMLETKGLTGKATITGSVKASGVSARSLVEQMVGTGTIQVRDMVMEGFDLNAISRKVLAARTVDDVGGLARVALEGGTTRINQMEAKFAIKENLMQFPVTGLTTDYTQGGIQATVDILRFLMNARFSFTPKTATDATVPPVHLLVQGNAEKPVKKLDTSELEAYIAKRAVRSGL